MDREHILSEIRRTAAANGGKALGAQRFRNETGIAKYDWQGHWSEWGDAVKAAGLEPNTRSAPYPEELLVRRLVEITRKLNRVPTYADLVLATRSDSSLPSEPAFRRLGNKAKRGRRIISYCETHPGNEDVADLWKTVAHSSPGIDVSESDSADLKSGYVYLVKHGSRSEYRVGKASDPIRREGELRVQLPEPLEPIHTIKTDDPTGVETYWLRRFADKRKNGDWFALTPQDVRAFKRWKRIY